MDVDEGVCPDDDGPVEPNVYKPLTYRPSQDEIREYYSKYFPEQLVWNFLVKYLGDESLVRHMELTFDRRVVNAAGEVESVYVRGIKVASPESLKRILVNNAPAGVSMGAVYQCDGDLMPQASRASKKPLCKGLSVDFDANDFLRTCACEGTKDICETCWNSHCRTTLALAREHQFALTGRPMLAVFSGRKGFHGHVLGSPFLTPPDRARFLSYLEAQISLNGTPKIFDHGVTSNMNHTIRLPLSVNANSGLVVLPIEENTSLQRAAIHVSEIPKLKDPVVLPGVWKKYCDVKSIWGPNQQKN